MIKPFIWRSALALAVACSLAFTPDELRKLPSVEVKSIKGKKVNASEIADAGKTALVVVWDVNCRPGVNALTVIGREYAAWQKETGMKVIAVSVDEFRNATTVQSLYLSKGWTFEVYLDQNQDFKRAVNVNVCPSFFVLNGSGEIVWQKVGYNAGDEKLIFEVVRKIAKGEKIE